MMNLLEFRHTRDGRKRADGLRYVRNAAIGLGLLLAASVLVLVVPSIGSVRLLYTHAQLGKDDLYRAKDAAEAFDFKAAEAALDDAVTDFELAEDAIDRFGLGARLPFVRKEVAAARGLVRGGHEAAVALREAVMVGDDLMAVIKSGVGSINPLAGIIDEERPAAVLTKEERQALLKALSEASDRLGLARAAVERALAAFENIAPTPLTAGLIASIEPHKQKLRELRDYLSRDLSILKDIPAILGYPEAKTYLFLLLNNTEMRPGGGFIGTYGIVKLSDGGIESFFTDDIYALDGPSEAYLREEPPLPLKRWLRSPGWYMRDSNWSPDFVVSAMETERFYRLEGGAEAKLDGVIGVTPTVVSRLLEITGPIVIDGIRFDAANITDELEFQVERGFAKDGVPYAQRKDIVGKLGEVLVEKLMALPLAKLAMLTKLGQEMIAEKHLMATFEDPALQKLADTHGWSGRMPIAAQDELFVIDANLASLKTDPVVDKNVAYSIRPDGNSWIARAAITYKHNGRFNWKTTRLRTYTRFYAPAGSVFLKGEGMMNDDKINDPKRTTGGFDIGSELGRAVFGAFISIEPGETRTLAVEYRVSEAVAKAIKAGVYELDFRKQLGTPGHDLTLDLDFGKKVTRATPGEPEKEWGDSRYRFLTDLKVDRHFKVELK
jgi:hypothetical protein